MWSNETVGEISSVVPVGELAGLGAAISWAVGSVVFSTLRVPAAALNLAKNIIATVLLLVTLIVVAAASGVPVLRADGAAWIWLSLSSVVGLLIGDTCYFRSIQILGPRRALVLTTLVPPFAAVFGWVQHRERLSLLAAVGMATTLAGVIVVLRERGARSESAGHYPGTVAGGVLYGAGGALCQAVGAAWSKRGMQGSVELSGLEGSFIRLLVAAVAGLALAVVARRLAGWLRHVRAPGTPPRLLLASFCGTYLGIWFSLVAYNRSELAVATTLTSTSPVFVLPLVAVFLGQRVSPRAMVGSLIALGGVALLFIRP